MQLYFRPFGLFYSGGGGGSCTFQILNGCFFLQFKTMLIKLIDMSNKVDSYLMNNISHLFSVYEERIT